MPKDLLQIKSFNFGIINAIDKSDVPEGGLVNATNVMCDVPGKIRMMGQDKVHDDLNNEISAIITPGYGLFAYRSDFRVSDDEPIESKILAFQNNRGIGFYDIDSTVSLLQLGGLAEQPKPVFYYTSIDGALRVCDANYDNIEGLLEPNLTISDTLLNTNSHIFVKYLKYINKTWFPEGVTYASGSGFSPEEFGFATHDFANNNSGFGLDAYIYPPTVASSITALAADAGATHNLCHQATAGNDDVNTAVTVSHLRAADQGGANVAIHVTHTDDTTATWGADSELKFGVSFSYEGGQESPVTNFAHNGANTGTPIDNDLYSLDVNLYVSTSGWDPRITGINLYYVGKSTGEFVDPLRLMEFHFGSSQYDPPEIRTSDGDKYDASNITIDYDAATGLGVAYNSTAIKIKHEPSLTFSLINEYESDVDTIAASYQTCAIANRRAYIGGVRRYKFDVNTIADEGWQDGQNAGFKQPELSLAQITPELDTIYMSPVDMFDIFPKSMSNTLSIGSNDGEHIIALVEYADRLLQFKQNKLYILLISADHEQIEAEYDYMGIQYPYQVIRTEKGIAWSNVNGCYLYNGETVINLIENKIHKDIKGESKFHIEGWSQFSNNTGMIGYVPISEQLVIFENPEAASTGAAGDAFIYDFKTESWTKGVNVLSSLPKSNIVTNYDNTCMYATLATASTEELVVEQKETESIGVDAYWQLDNCSASSMSTDNDGSRLKIGTTNITDPFFWPDGNDTFIQTVINHINAKQPYAFEFSSPQDGSLRIIRPSNMIDGTYSGALSWDTSGSYGPPTTSAVTIASLTWNVKMRHSLTVVTNELGFFNYNFEIEWVNSGTQWVTGREVYLTSDVVAALAKNTIVSPDRFAEGYISDSARDEPRVKLTYTSGGAVWDGDDALVCNFDLYSRNGDEEGQVFISNSSRETHMVTMSYVNHPRLDGTGTLGRDSNAIINNANDELIVTLADGGDILYTGMMQMPTAVFMREGNTFYGSDGEVSTYFRMTLVGDYSNTFSAGNTYTIAGVESEANHDKANALNISLKVNMVQFQNYNDDDENNVVLLTHVIFAYNEQSSGTQTDNWPWLCNWTTFNTITITTASVATIGQTNIGSVGTPGYYHVIPKRHNSYASASTNNEENPIYSTYSLGIDGQNGNSYNIIKEADTTTNAYEISSEFKSQLDLIHTNSNIKPFGTPSLENINRAEILYDEDGITVTQLSTTISSTGTTSFVLTDTTNLVVGQYLQFLGTLYSTSGAEIVKVTAISDNGTTITVTRAQLGTSALGTITAESATGIFKLNVIKQTTSTTFSIYGGDYRHIFMDNVLFKVNTGLDTNGANAWPDPTVWSVVGYSSYSSPDTTGHYTVVYLNTEESHSDADVGDTALDGNSGSFYTSYENLPIIETSVLKVPGRLTSNSGLPILQMGGMVTRSLEIREFLNTEEYAKKNTKHEILIITPEYDFGAGNQEVRLYKVSMSARLRNGHVSVWYSIDGGEFKLMRNSLGMNDLEPIGKQFSSIDMYFESPTAGIRPITAKRLQLQISGKPGGFELNDISVVFRPKGGVR